MKDGFSNHSGFVERAEHRLRLSVVTGPALNDRHGTGVQILRLFEATGIDYWHLFWLGTAGYRSDHDESVLLNTLPRLKRLRGGRLIDILEEALGIGWWNGERVNPGKLRRLLASRGWSSDVAYVCPANEREARQMNSIMEVLGRPYVVHLMDLCHDEGIVPEAMPGYRTLLCRAERVFVASEPMRDEVMKIRCDNVEVVALAKQMTRAADAPTEGGPLRLVMLGSLGSADNPALGILADALPVLKYRWPGFDCLYMGQHYHLMPDRLKAHVTYPGRVDLDTFERLLPTAHLAFLPSPQRLDSYGRFAPVARITDFFMAGLPIIYCVGEGSQPENFLRQNAPAAARFVRSSEEFVAAVGYFADPSRWHLASRQIREYAEKHFSIKRLRDHIQDAMVLASNRT
jgi:hypothetical protein